MCYENFCNDDESWSISSRIFLFDKNLLILFGKKGECTKTNSIFFICPGGGIGRRAGLKILFQQWSAGSIPAPGTTQYIRRLDYYCKVLSLWYDVALGN